MSYYKCKFCKETTRTKTLMQKHSIKIHEEEIMEQIQEWEMRL